MYTFIEFKLVYQNWAWTPEVRLNFILGYLIDYIRDYSCIHSSLPNNYRKVINGLVSECSCIRRQLECESGIKVFYFGPI